MDSIVGNETRFGGMSQNPSLCSCPGEFWFFLHPPSLPFRGRPSLPTLRRGPLDFAEVSQPAAVWETTPGGRARRAGRVSLIKNCVVHAHPLVSRSRAPPASFLGCNGVGLPTTPSSASPFGMLRVLLPLLLLLWVRMLVGTSRVPTTLPVPTVTT